MGRTATLTIIGVAILLSAVGCNKAETPGNSPAAKDQLLAPTDVSKLNPTQRAKVEGIMKGNAAASQNR
jgi:hypothetical protein